MTHAKLVNAETPLSGMVITDVHLIDENIDKKINDNTDKTCSIFYALSSFNLKMGIIGKDTINAAFFAANILGKPLMFGGKCFICIFCN